MTPKTPTTAVRRLIHPNRVRNSPCAARVSSLSYLRIQIERRLNLAVTQDPLHGLRLDFALFTNPLLSETVRSRRM